jgi:predicted Zn finger-like uncharacterized protein
MKITCQSCQAKYTIADEKVVGKTVKIKCKKCGATIVVNGNEVGAAASGAPEFPRPTMDEEGATRVFSGPEPGAAPGADEWTVNVSDDDQRTMTTAQLQQAYAAGTLTADTYVWKDGMGDWLPLSNVPELVAAVSRPGPAAGAAYAAPAPAPAPEPEPHDNAATVAYAVSPFHQPGAQAAYAAASAAAAAPPAAESAPAAAARRAGGGRGGVDLFGGNAEQRSEAPQAAAGGRDERLVGERNENSVLFSLSALTASETANRRSGGAGGRDEAVIDMRAPAPGPGRRDVDDIMNLGGGGFAAPILAPPPLLAPVAEPPPQSAPVGVAASLPAPMGGPAAPEKKSSMVGLIAGVAIGIAIVGGAAIYFLRPPPPPAAARADTGAATAQPSAVAAVTPTPTPTATPTAAPTAAPADTAAASATPSATPSAVAAATPADKPAAGGGAKAADKPAPGGAAAPGPVAAAQPAAAAKPDKPADPPPAATAAPAAAPAAGGNEFNRGAAASALGAAAGSAKSCKKADGPTGTGRVKVTFAPSGNVTSAVVDGPPFSGTSVGGCVAAAFRGAHVPPFDGAPVVVSKSFTIN